MAIQPASASFYADPASLEGLKRGAATQSPEALREAARQFESLFTTMMLKSMRSATGDDPLFGSDQADFYQDMFDQQLAVELGKGRGMGLADMLVRQLMQRGGEASATPQAVGRPGDTQSPTGGDTASALTGVAPLASARSDGTAWPPRSREDFVQAIRPAATAAARELGVDADTIIAHAALETGWGRAVPAGGDGRPGFNLFGIKAGGGWRGASATHATHEFIDGRMQKVSASFRSYDSPEAAVGDYVRLLKGNPRYAAALGTGGDAAAFARGLVAGGYATDPAYVAKLSAVAAQLKGGNSLPINNPTAA